MFTVLCNYEKNDVVVDLKQLLRLSICSACNDVNSVSSGFGTSTSSSGGLFGSTNTTSNPFGGATSLFGGSGFSATQQPGTTVKFNVSDYSSPLIVFLLLRH